MTEYVSDVYYCSKVFQPSWLNANEPRQGEIHKDYVKFRARFKYAFHFIRKNEDIMRKDAMARTLAYKNNNDFWREISANNKYETLPLDRVKKASG